MPSRRALEGVTGPEQQLFLEMACDELDADRHPIAVHLRPAG
ncbi:hypothetical protein [Novosphingobium sp. Rr 2-17]|nr:hypothetical protein [Novosphingobium sp. Rr 2-17]